MKKSISIFLGLFLLITSAIDAQKFNFGVLAGFDITKSFTTKEKEISNYGPVYSPMISFNVNGIINCQFHDRFALSAEPGFIQKGGIEKSSNNSRTQLNYLQIPLLLNIKIVHNIYTSIGPEFSYLILANLYGKGHSVNISKIYDKRFELSGLCAINYSISEKIDLGIRYNRSLTYNLKIGYTDENGNVIGQMKEFNQYFQFMIKYKPNWR